MTVHMPHCCPGAALALTALGGTGRAGGGGAGRASLALIGALRVRKGLSRAYLALGAPAASREQASP
jgi:hypothetical protein